MYLSVNVQHGQDDQLILVQQLGVEGVVVVVDDPEPATVLAAARHRVERAGLTLAAVELTTGVTAAVVEAAKSAGVSMLCTPAAVSDEVGAAAEAAGVKLASRCAGPAELPGAAWADWVPGPDAADEVEAMAPRLGAVRLEGALADSGLPRLLARLRAAGYAGPVRAATPPELVGDGTWRHKGRAYDLGFLAAALQAVAAAGASPA